MAADTWESLIAKISSRTQTALEKKVAPIVEKELAESAKRATGPASRSSGGIADPKNIISEVVGDTLVTRDIAKPQSSLFGPNYKKGYESYSDPYGTLFSEWINDERWEVWPYDGSHTKREGIPFVTYTQEEINSNPNLILDTLKKGIEGK